MGRAETIFRSHVVKALSPLLAFPVENSVGEPGVPDVCCLAGWLELKVVTKVTTQDAILRVDVRPAQRVWMRNWRSQGGPGWFLTKVPGLVMLHDGVWAAEYLGDVSYRETVSRSQWCACKLEGLIEALTDRSR